MKIDKRLFIYIRHMRLYMVTLGGLSMLVATLIVLQAHFITTIINGVFLAKETLAQVLGQGQALSPRGFWFGQGQALSLLVVIGVRAGLFWFNEMLAHKMATQAKTTLRNRLFEHLLTLGPIFMKGERSGELVNTATEGIETLDAYFSQVLPQICATAIIPIIILIVVFANDLLSGIVLLVTLPILPIFMVLIGKQAEAATKKRWYQLSQMSAHFLDVLQGATILKLFGRNQHQKETIRRMSDRFGNTTLQVLRIAFLSALVMEMGATISMAIVAVEIGLRLLYGQISFASAFFVLLLTPEYYQPLRALGPQFHASMDSAAGAKRIFDILDTPLPTKSPVGTELALDKDSRPTELAPGKDSRPTELLPGKDSRPTELLPGKDSRPTELVSGKDSRPTELALDQDNVGTGRSPIGANMGEEAWWGPGDRKGRDGVNPSSTRRYFDVEGASICRCVDEGLVPSRLLRLPGPHHATFPMLVPTGASPVSKIQPAIPLRTGENFVGAGGFVLSQLTFESVHYAYSDPQGESHTALRGVSFTMKMGQRVALVGPSGSGKTTIAHLLLRFIEPQQGTIRANGVAIQEFKAQDWRKLVAWQPQHPYLFNTTVVENIRMGRADASMDEVVAAAQQAHIHDLIQTLPQGYHTTIGERGMRLSGGQVQRLSLARAFLKDAPLLILDEATSTLDTETEAHVLAALDTLMQGRMVLIIAHRLHTIRSADQILVLKEGNVLDSGTHTTLMQTSKAYQQLAQAYEDGKVIA
jgi:ABC-type transport system involved in cytochrome bd biosynthesis fused ATPase/permease subunit